MGDGEVFLGRDRRRARAHLHRGAGRMKVALRDDDTSYFTEPGRLEAVYHDVWDRIPVGLAVIPQAAGFVDKAIPEKYWDAGRSFPLDENAALAESLRKLVKDGRVTISQHGFTHEDYP